jgi:hypothetical protein
MQSLPPALQPLAEYKQFIAYQLVPSATRPGKTDKFPINIGTGRKHDPTDPGGWRTHDEVSAWVADRKDHGCAFVFTENDPFFFLDIDGQYQGGAWTPLATQLANRFTGAAVEVSQSFTGLHIIGQYRGDRPIHGCKSGGVLELYTADRFVALTGLSTVGSAAHDATEALQAAIAEYFPASLGAEVEDGWWSHEAVEGWTGHAEDEELLAVALRSQSAASAFGSKASFADLWYADEGKLGTFYPGDNGRPWDGNSADMALAQHLAFHTGKNAQRMLDLMQRSALVRDKWDRPDYLPRTIRKACSLQTDVFKRREVQPREYEAQQVDAARQESTVVRLPKPQRVVGTTFLAADEQEKMFDGCCYVSEVHRIFSPDGHLYRHEQFRALYGGYSFPMDAEGSRISRDAWECFTESQLIRFPRTRGVCFKPNLPPGSIVDDGGRDRINTFVPIRVARMPGDVEPFLTHMAKMLPVESDRLTLLAYMAACVQHQGIKFQWAPLIQGVEGNGKTLLALCVAEAVGARYVHWPLAKDIDNTFNSWLWGNVFYAVDEIFIEDSRAHVLETLKPMVTANKGGIQITQKGVDQTTQDICGNFMFLTNHRNAVHLKPNERRVAPFFTAQQRREDLRRDGMDEAYFQKLFEWFEDGGYAKVSEFLHTWPIPRDLDPRWHSRKPMTSTTGEAVKAGQGRAEQEVLDHIEQGEPGFAGGWVSSTMLARLFDSMRLNIPKARYKDIMQELGYELHPGLADGRVNQVVVPDGNKPRLYVRADSLLADMREPGEIAKAYQGAQGMQLGG